MYPVAAFGPGNYRFVPGVLPYSRAVAAMPGFRIQRVQFRRPAPLAEGFARIEQVLKDAGRPTTAFCSCELRSPAPYPSISGFRSFNELYIATLARWKIYDGVTNPVTRCNLCPIFDPPSEPSFHSFSYTVQDTASPRSFVLAGAWDAPDGMGPEAIIRRGDVSPSGLREKARFVLGELELRLAALGHSWADVTATQAYTVHNLHSFLVDEIIVRGAARSGLTWHFTRPVVEDFEFEMDCRAVYEERVI